jgi:hypothetical protein
VRLDVQPLALQTWRVESMMRKLLIAFGLAALSLPVGGVYAASNPSGTGQPNQTCQVINASATNPAGATGPFYPGNAESARGSVFAEPGGVFTNGGTGGTQYNLVGAPSQYDVACYQMSQKP